MELFDAVRTVLGKYATFTGRASRPEFWWFALFSVIAHLALNSLNIFTAHGTVYLGASLSGMFEFLVFVPTLAVAVRRLHDTGRHWTKLFWLLLPIAGLIILIVYFAAPSEDQENRAPMAPAVGSPGI